MNGKLTNVLKYQNGSYKEEKDLVAEEISIRIILNGQLFGTLMCSPWDPEELAVGYLCVMGMIRSYEDILRIETTDGTVYADCRVPVQKTPESEKRRPTLLRPADVMRLSRELDQSSERFRQTGGVHNAGISDGRHIITNTEDVSRHNAMNRLVGRCLMQEINLKDKVIVFSGRVPEEIIKVVARMKCGAIISVSAPTSKTIEIAQKNHVMLICFARGDRFNVYTCQERLIRTQKENGTMREETGRITRNTTAAEKEEQVL